MSCSSLVLARLLSRFRSAWGEASFGDGRRGIFDGFDWSISLIRSYQVDQSWQGKRNNKEEGKYSSNKNERGPKEKAGDSSVVVVVGPKRVPSSENGSFFQIFVSATTPPSARHLSYRFLFLSFHLSMNNCFHWYQCSYRNNNNNKNLHSKSRHGDHRIEPHCPALVDEQSH